MSLDDPTNSLVGLVRLVGWLVGCLVGWVVGWLGWCKMKVKVLREKQQPKKMRARTFFCQKKYTGFQPLFFEVQVEAPFWKPTTFIEVQKW